MNKDDYFQYLMGMKDETGNAFAKIYAGLFSANTNFSSLFNKLFRGIGEMA